MEYNFQIHLSFEQLLQLASQLPEQDKSRLISALSSSETPPNASQETTMPETQMPPINMRAAAEILDPDYHYPNKKPNSLIAAWQGDESIETLLSLRQK